MEHQEQTQYELKEVTNIKAYWLNVVLSISIPFDKITDSFIN